MPRRKRRKARQSDDVEDQLRKQRQERQGISKESQTRRPKQPVLGKFVYDPDRDAYLPNLHSGQNECPKKEFGEIFPSHPHSVIPKRSVVIYNMVSEVSSPSLRRRISSRLRGRSLLSRITVGEDSVSQFRLTLHTPPHHCGFSATPTDNGGSSIALSGGDHIALFAQKGQSDAEISFYCSVNFSYMEAPSSTIKHSPSGDTVAFLADQQRSIIFLTNRIRLTHQQQFPVNDFSMVEGSYGRDVITAHDGGFWQLRGRRKVVSSSSKICSDILAIENWVGKNRVICGHRDGRPSLGDLRDGTSCWTCKPDIAFGNIASVRPISDLSFLAKSYRGACRLYDVRMTSPVFHMDHGNNFCKGMNTDPANSVLIHPSLTNENTSVLEVWSLLTGEYIDACKLPGSGACELCPTIIPGLKHRSFGLYIGRPSTILRVRFNERYFPAKA